jgi:predicted nuclease with TOPRIM domain
MSTSTTDKLAQEGRVVANVHKCHNHIARLKTRLQHRITEVERAMAKLDEKIDKMSSAIKRLQMRKRPGSTFQGFKKLLKLNNEYELLLAEYTSSLTNEWASEEKPDIEDQVGFLQGRRVEVSGYSRISRGEDWRLSE